MEGQYSDPDGEAVSFSIKVGDAVYAVEVMGNTWETEWVDLHLSQWVGKLARG